jgi:hypothetical protein
VINQAGLQKNTNNMLDKCMFVHVQIVAGRPKVDFSVTEKKKKIPKSIATQQEEHMLPSSTKDETFAFDTFLDGIELIVDERLATE